MYGKGVRLHETSHDLRLSDFLYVWLFSDLKSPPKKCGLEHGSPASNIAIGIYLRFQTGRPPYGRNLILTSLPR